jgi:hypothetical protein
MGGAFGTYGREQKWFWYGNMNQKYHLEGLEVDGRILLKWTLKEMGWTGFNWLRIGKSGGLL